MLPKLVTPKYDMIIPSTGETVTYRPYVVKEEKILLIAFESQDETQIEKSVLDIIKTCIESKIDLNKLTTFDIEFMFVTLRSKSVGEGIKLNMPCEECEHTNEVKINLDELNVANLDEEIDKHVKLTGDISVDLKWMAMNDRLSGGELKTETDAVINLVAKSIETIYSGEEIHSTKDVTKKEVVEFVESLNTDQFQSITEVIGKSPYLNYTMKFDCDKCGHSHERELNGLADFFQ
jgi:rubrerythrin